MSYYAHRPVCRLPVQQPMYVVHQQMPHSVPDYCTLNASHPTATHLHSACCMHLFICRLSMQQPMHERLT
eukprot:scaffold203450_cov21-Tisochrysis_lutea.AAC.2